MMVLVTAGAVLLTAGFLLIVLAMDRSRRHMRIGVLLFLSGAALMAGAIIVSSGWYLLIPVPLILWRWT